MNIQSLVYFATAAKYLSFTKAAEECLIAQPAMSRQIAGIEEELGVKLFLRYNKQVKLTTAGKAFYAEVQEILRRYSNAVFVTRDIHSGLNEKLSIGFGLYDTPIVSALVKRFASLNPTVSITLNQHPYDVLIQKLKEGEYDIAFCPNNRTLKLTKANIIPVKVAYRTIAVSPESPLASKSIVETADLEQQILINPAEDGAMHPEIFSVFCAKAGFEPRKILFANTLDAILTMVEAGFGAAIVPDFLKETTSYNVKFIPLKLDIERARVHVIVSLTTNTNKTVGKFMAMSSEFYQIYD